MTQEQFIYWLQGKLEGRDIKDPELKMIQGHLATVFKKVTPSLTCTGTATIPTYPSDITNVPYKLNCPCNSIVPCPVHGSYVVTC